MRLKIEMETEEEIEKFADILPAEVTNIGLTVSDLFLVRRLLLAISGIKNRTKGKEVQVTAKK